MPVSQKSSGLFLSGALGNQLEDTPPTSPKSAFLDHVFESPQMVRSKLRCGPSTARHDPLIDMYNEKRRANTLTQLEEQLVREVVDLRKKMLKLLPAREPESPESHIDAFKLSPSVQNILRSIRAGPRGSSTEYHLIKCMKALKHTEEELYTTKQLVEKQNAMLESLLVQNSELMAYIRRMQLQQ
ncbi:Hypothetical protein DHA2_153683 [Giardia duodenalis]|uniref:Uncharacterized protein n=1 Tax=Giardia intestinalis TaxID=5741 RepID=V6TFR5_GIAIN|nr:Hypothetical protein DHA2_153683 [Giardia intestinalis]